MGRFELDSGTVWCGKTFGFDAPSDPSYDHDVALMSRRAFSAAVTSSVGHPRHDPLTVRPATTYSRGRTIPDRPICREVCPKDNRVW